MLVVIDNYDSFTYNLVHYLGELGARVRVHRNDKITVGDVFGEDITAILLSPGPCTPNEAGICLDLVAEAEKRAMPLFGVCLGMQAIGQAFGGKVVHAPSLLHGKVTPITHLGGELFSDIPERFEATRYHSLIVDRNSLPETLRVTAQDDGGLVMALEHTVLPISGVQFHPESIASEHGHRLLSNFLDLAARWHSGERRRANA
jgi:anthranilate synthase component 2